MAAIVYRSWSKLKKRRQSRRNMQQATNKGPLVHFCGGCQENILTLTSMFDQISDEITVFDQTYQLLTKITIFDEIFLINI